MTSKTKPRIILYSKEVKNCPCHEKIFNSEFELLTIESEDKFIEKIHCLGAEAAVVCFCSAHEEDVEQLLRLETRSGLIPVISCFKTFNPNFIQSAAQHGMHRFLYCDMEVEKIKNSVYETIHRCSVKEYLVTRYAERYALSHYIAKLIEEIIHTFPRRPKVSELADKLGISQSWLHKLCLSAFQRNLTSLIRHIWVYQALRIMQKTKLDNVEIAIELNYSEESNMAREFRKELGYSPNQARKRLTRQSPEELLKYL